jgi:hypothetical protein
MKKRPRNSSKKHKPKPRENFSIQRQPTPSGVPSGPRTLPDSGTQSFPTPLRSRGVGVPSFGKDSKNSQIGMNVEEIA